MATRLKRPETQQEEARRGNRMMEQLYGDVRREKGLPVPVRMDEPVRAVRAPRVPSGDASEASILKAIMQLLHRHPKVAKVWRQNSMAAEFQDRHGRVRYVRANTAKGMSDIMGILKDGRTLAIECKSTKGTVKAHQHEFLNSISAAGGIAFVARSVDDVIAKLEGA